MPKNKNNKFGLGSSSLDRKANNRNEKQVVEEKPLMLFSFKDFQYNQQIPPGQSYKTWQKEEILADMLEKFGFICQKTFMEVQNEKIIRPYRIKEKIDDVGFPLKSEFENPFPDVKLTWAVIDYGRKKRVIGHIIDNVFYVVFLDSEHKFYLYEA